MVDSKRSKVALDDSSLVKPTGQPCNQLAGYAKKPCTHACMPSQPHACACMVVHASELYTVEYMQQAPSVGLKVQD